MAKDYIEREAAKDAVCKAFVKWGSEDQYHESTHQIDRIPAADVVPVRQGRWREVENGESGHLCECSACKEWMLFYYGFVANFCPNCGALMDKDGDAL